MASYYGGGAPNSGGSGAGGGFYGQPPPQQQPTYQQQSTFQPTQPGAGFASPNLQQWMPQPQQQQQQQLQQNQQQLQQPQNHQPQQYDASQTQGPMQPMQQQPQQQPLMPSFWNPAAASTMASVAMAAAAAGGSGGGQLGGAGTAGFSNEAVLDFASTAGRTFLQSGTARMVPGLESAMLTLRSYFAVDNRYVLRKMRLVLFPFLSKNWRRSQKERPGPNVAPIYDLPNVDENAPDLYIPIMSLITYVLLSAFAFGTSGKFNPEFIPDVTTKCCVTQILEVLAMRFGFYLMQAPVAFLDLFSYTGYKYLGLCINMLMGLLLGHFGLGARGYYVTMLWTASAAAFFMLKTMADNIPTVTAATGPKREVMVLAFAAYQFATMWFVSQTKFLDDHTAASTGTSGGAHHYASHSHLHHQASSSAAAT